MKIKATSRTYGFVTLDEAKEQANIPKTFLDDDVLIARMLRVATKEAENYIENVVALTTYEAIQEEFSGRLIDIAVGHFHSLQSIEYTDKDGQLVTLSAGTGYRINNEEFVFLITLDELIHATDLKVSFTCGFDASTIAEKEEIKQAVLVKFVDLYDVERGSYTTNNIQYQRTFESLLNYNKRIRFI
jgi:hypothetical protein